MKAQKNTVVVMHYTLKNDQGVVLDSSEGKDPLAFIQGVGNIITGLETQIEGKEAGDKVQAVVSPEDGYGERFEELVHVVPKSGFRGEGDQQLTVGMQVQVETNNGVAIAAVTNIEGENVTLDLNHPLAGETLHFDVEIVEVREATAEELEHGHAHGEGGVEHE